MEIVAHYRAREEFNRLDKEVKAKFSTIAGNILSGKPMAGNKYKKLSGTKKLSEMRVRAKNRAYRGICALIEPNLIILLFFRKSGQKMPIRFIRLAENRLKQLINTKTI